MPRKPPVAYRVTFHAPDGQALDEAALRAYLRRPAVLAVLGRLGRAALDAACERETEHETEPVAPAGEQTA